MSENYPEKMGGDPIFRRATPKFWATAEDLNRLLESAHHQSHWDFNEAVGDTIKEKYQSLYVHAAGFTDYMVDQGVSGHFWMATNRKVMSIFETSSCNLFQPTPWKRDEVDPDFEVFGVLPLGTDKVRDVGVLSYRWHLYSCDKTPKNLILFGVENREMDASNYGRLEIHHYIA